MSLLHSGRFRAGLFLSAWLSLVIAGVLCRDVFTIVVTFPLLLISLLIGVLLWRSSAGKSIGATLFYSIGMLAILCGVFRFGVIATIIQGIDNQSYAKFLDWHPARPHAVREILLWSVADVAVCIGLVLGKQYRRTAIALVTALLLLINPAILWLVAWLQPSMGM